MRLLPLVALSTLIACSGDSSGEGSDGSETGPAAGIALLGGGSHSSDNVSLETIGTDADGLEKPTDLAFHPDMSGELWVTNQEDESITLFFSVATGTQDSRLAKDATGEHFMGLPSGLAFGENGNFATSHDKFEPTQGGATDEFFMGPTLWTADSETFDGGHESHLDMLHNTPRGKGIAWDGGNRYWIFDGYHESITLYDFHDDHGLGGASHSDGEIVRYGEGEVLNAGDVASHLEMDRTTSMLYIADSGNGRVAVLDTTTGARGDDISPNYDGGDWYLMNGATITTLIDLTAAGMGKPVGLALSADGILYVSTNAPSQIVAVDLAGTVLDYLDLAGTPSGLALAEDGSLYFADPVANEVVRISAP